MQFKKYPRLSLLFSHLGSVTSPRNAPPPLAVHTHTQNCLHYFAINLQKDLRDAAPLETTGMHQAERVRQKHLPPIKKN